VAFSQGWRYVRKLGLSNSAEYGQWANGGLKGLPDEPPEVPAQPWLKYRNEWRGWSAGPNSSSRLRAGEAEHDREIAQAVLKSSGRPGWLNTLTDLTRATDHGEGWQQDYHMDSAA
jgi:hypothetical protein